MKDSVLLDITNRRSDVPPTPTGLRRSGKTTECSDQAESVIIKLHGKGHVMAACQRVSDTVRVYAGCRELDTAPSRPLDFSDGCLLLDV